MRWSSVVIFLILLVSAIDMMRDSHQLHGETLVDQVFYDILRGLTPVGVMLAIRELNTKPATAAETGDPGAP